MAMMLSMTNGNTFDKLSAGIDVILKIAGNELKKVSETDSRFSVQLHPRGAETALVLQQLAPYAELFDVSVALEIQQGNGKAHLTTHGLQFVDWNLDPDLSPPDIDAQTSELFGELTQQFSQGGSVDASKLVDDLQQLVSGGALCSLTVLIFLDKRSLLANMKWPNETRGLLYVSADKLQQAIQGGDFATLNNLLTPQGETSIVLMLGDTKGITLGPNIRICGRDQWTTENTSAFRASRTDSKRIEDAIAFRGEECLWEIPIQGLTPYHLVTDEVASDHAGIVKSIHRLCQILSITYLADRVSPDEDGVICEFRGHKRVRVRIPSMDSKLASNNSICSLLEWGYDNSSSDKLNIIRQVISLQLGEDETANFSALVKSAHDILEIAKSNFRLFLRHSVELYFDKRLKVSEHVQRFSNEVGKGIADLTSELVSNVYKTVGIIIGVAVASLVKPEMAGPATYWSSFLYLIYIGFIVLYLLPSAYLRFRSGALDYHHQVLELRDVLSEGEISKLEGYSFQRASRIFLVYFGLTNVIYALLGAIAYLITQAASI